MIEFNDLTYAAIITIELPGMDQPATITVTLAPADTIKTASGQVKALRDCSLADLSAFADALESEIWQTYQAISLPALADTEDARLKITILDKSGGTQAVERDKWLEHAILLEPQAKTAPGQEPLPEEEPQAAPAPEGEPAPALPPEQEQGAELGDGAPAEPAETPAEEEATPSPERETAEEIVEEAADEQTVPTATGDEAQPAEAVEKPVVDGVEPVAAPAEAVRPQRQKGEIRILGLRRPLGHPTPSAVDILMNEAAFRDAQAHALTSLDREVAGMLVGPQPEKQPDGRYVVHISDIIIAKHTRMAGASVTYTPESWRYVTDILHERYPDEEAVIVGWYHTHPNFGIFLSGMDLFIHQNFFTQKWHVALVLDPVNRRSGFFSWDRRQTAVQPYEFPWPPWASESW